MNTYQLNAVYHKPSFVIVMLENGYTFEQTSKVKRHKADNTKIKVESGLEISQGVIDAYTGRRNDALVGVERTLYLSELIAIQQHEAISQLLGVNPPVERKNELVEALQISVNPLLQGKQLPPELEVRQENYGIFSRS